MLLYRVVCVIIGYIFGLLQTGYLYGKINHIDIRDYGSGNAGTTNAMRVLGKKAGIITYLGDMLKGILAGIIVRLIFTNVATVSSSQVIVLILYTGIGVVLGHNFPFYMNFKGGKGIAASSGVIFSLLDLKLALFAIVTFVFFALIFRYVSLASIAMMVGFLIEFITFSQLGLIKGLTVAGFKYESYVLVFILVAMAIIRHKSNIIRLINGTERKIGQKKSE